MSAANGGMRPEGQTFFTSAQVFPEVSADGKIDTIQFLEAAKGVVALVDMFGKTFAPVKSDMNGNIEKLTKQYNKNKAAHETIHDMIIAEQKAKEDYAIVALLWLKRALHFFQVFLECVVKDAKEGKNTENLAPFLKEAYTASLEKYHGWTTQQLFWLLQKVCPNRKDIMFTMSLGHPGRDSMVIRDLEPFIVSLEKTVKVVDDLYRQQGLDLEAKA